MMKQRKKDKPGRAGYAKMNAYMEIIARNWKKVILEPGYRKYAER